MIKKEKKIYEELNKFQDTSEYPDSELLSEFYCEHSRVLVNKKEIIGIREIKKLEEIIIIFKISSDEKNFYKHQIRITGEHIKELIVSADRLNKYGFPAVRYFNMVGNARYNTELFQELDEFLIRKEYYNPENLLEELFAVTMFTSQLTYNIRTQEYDFKIRDCSTYKTEKVGV